uniref:Uncharacterized protein n=1 Tax=Timema bartmani TaxID=61472 RepID=A0A7R9EXX5_9NEOP|nr:unnamed protein product [Timema bartmani]
MDSFLPTTQDNGMISTSCAIPAPSTAGMWGTGQHKVNKGRRSCRRKWSGLGVFIQGGPKCIIRLDKNIHEQEEHSLDRRNIHMDRRNIRLDICTWSLEGYNMKHTSSSVQPLRREDVDGSIHYRGNTDGLFKGLAHRTVIVSDSSSEVRVVVIVCIDVGAKEEE